MISMPHRSVTRFFIPLIDVLLLLFCIFLLMPLFSEENAPGGESGARLSQAELNLTVESLERQLDLRIKELSRFENLKEPLAEIERLRLELERLRKEQGKPLNERIVVRILEIDKDNGELYFVDTSRGGTAKERIENAASAEALIERHRKEVGGRELFYAFLFPATGTGFPRITQTTDYRRWFHGVANSLQGAGS